MVNVYALANFRLANLATRIKQLSRVKVDKISGAQPFVR
uniref:Uncharacterized protein n=1 Tax=Pseudomonas monteilii TaxID=76759 RepID=A0A6B7Q0M8_9PSED|nr:hypothetical protein [Pseudomonas monteilii]